MLASMFTTKRVFNLTCPQCLQARPQDAYTEVELLDRLLSVEPIEGYCRECDYEWDASATDRATLEKDLI